MQCTFASGRERCDQPGDAREPDGRVLCDAHHTEIENRRAAINHERRMNRRASTGRF